MSDTYTEAPGAAATSGPAREGVDPSRVGPGIQNLRRHTARGVLINSGFDIGLSGLGTIQRLVVAAFLTRAEFGFWGIIVSIIINLSWLKDLGIGDKFIQQSEPDQEAAFQKAFTLELLSSSCFLLLVALLLPVWAIAYGHTQIILPGIVLALAVPLSAFETPSWIPYRQMQYGRQRLLTVVDPLVMFAVTVALAIAGASYWCFIAGALAGSLAGGAVCTLTCPYKMRLRFSRRTAREYASFSWPLVGAGLSRLLVVQGLLLVANRVVGVSGLGSIGLATTFAVFADRVDSIVSQTIYPAVCAVVHRKDLLAETFTKSNRIALIWAMPFGVGLALFAGDLVHYVLGERWHPAIGLLAAFGLTCALGQVAFNWAIYLRALNQTRPILVGSVVYLVTYLAVGVPGMILFGVPGYAVGFAVATAVQIALRGYYMRRLFKGFNVLLQLVRAISPVVPAALLILLVRALTPGGRGASRVIAELLLYSVATLGFTLLFERKLVVEVAGYVLGRTAKSPLAPAIADAPAQGSQA
jgi:O-antigen/teichoic acid export membrane protein